MEGKKVKIEVSRIALVFIILFGLCLLVWSFIGGVWVGSKLGSKEQEKIAAESTSKEELPPPPPPSLTSNESVTPPPSSGLNATAEKPVDLQKNASSQAFVPPSKPEPKAETQVTEKEKKQAKPKVSEVKEPSKEKTSTSKTKEVAKISNQIKQGSFVLQVGAFSQKESAEKLRTLAEKKGYKVTVKAVPSEGKTFYKVYVGRYASRDEAEKAATKVASDLGVGKPFAVELK
ncbi:SPOR domain-containing protein [Thermodesulfobacterium hveragerdense]|uniref:SPOR domain-containing protein n=1 Tax=Thermodesulfobacterium hveragerdense TaxID=53424 RepID=UPI000417DBB9|nr:SPOR domain-containing protein [Thermodesulfobacterium hveragerdense]